MCEHLAQARVARRLQARDVADMVLRQSLRGWAAGLMASSIQEWARVVDEARLLVMKKDAAHAALLRFSEDRWQAMVHACLMRWRTWTACSGHTRTQSASRSMAHAAVELMLRQWQRGHNTGLVGGALQGWAQWTKQAKSERLLRYKRLATREALTHLVEGDQAAAILFLPHALDRPDVA